MRTLTVAFVDRLVPVLVRGDVVGAWDLLDSLDGDELREARDWFAKNRRWLNSLHELDYEGGPTTHGSATPVRPTGLSP